MLSPFSVSKSNRFFLAILALLVLSACNSASTRSEEPDTTPIPAISLTATPEQVDINGNASLNWSSTDADSCTASGGWSGARSAAGSESVGPLQADTTFTMQCYGPGGDASRSVTVSVVDSAALSFSADRTIVNEGESVTLSWASDAVISCTASGDWSGNKPANGQETAGPLQTNSTFTLSCQTATETLVRSVNVSVTTEPALSFSADRTSINAGESVMLSWSSVSVDSCTASGDWSGNKPSNGQEMVGPLQVNSAFTLSCRTATETLVQTVNVSVAPQPALSLSADRTSVTAGQSVTLFWATESALSCTASGDWTGSKPLNGQEIVGPLQVDSAFTLSCATTGDRLVDTVNVTVTTTGGELNLEGGVDSSFIDAEGLNRVYVYAGDVQPDDYDGDSGDPVTSATVTQDPGACTWSYGLASGLQDGLYTVAFTAEAAGDNPAANDTLSFSGTTTITVSGGSAVHNFVPANIVRIGANRAFTTFAEASRAVADGAVVEVDPGVYQDDISIWRQNNLTLRGINGRAHLRAVALIPYTGGNDQHNGKGIIVTRGDNVRVENMEFSGARVPDLNGAGIRPEGGSISICNGYFHDNENGILGTGTQILIEYSEFDNNGLGEFGRTHNIYISEADRMIFRNSYSHHANIGHNLKSRARENYVLYSRLMDEQIGTSSYSVDFPNGGLSYVIGSLLQQGPQGDNSIILRYGAEGLAAGATHRFYVVNNTFVNDRQSGTFIRIAPGTESSRVTNNLFVGGGTAINGSAQQSGNLETNSPGLMNMTGYDYRLTAGSPAVDAGVAPGSGDGYSLVPVEHYLHPFSTEPRIQSGPIDIGAYEYTP